MSGLFEFWESGDWLPHIQDDLRMEKAMNKQYGVYALDEQEVSNEEVAQAWAELQEVASYVETQIAACDLSAVIAEVDGYPQVFIVL